MKKLITLIAGTIIGFNGCSSENKTSLTNVNGNAFILTQSEGKYIISKTGPINPYGEKTYSIPEESMMSIKEQLNSSESGFEKRLYEFAKGADTNGNGIIELDEVNR